LTQAVFSMPWQAITALWPVVAAVSEAWPRSSELYPASQACLIKCQFVTQSSTAMMTSQNRSSLETRWRQMCGFKTQRLPSTSPAKTMSLPSSASTECESNRTPSVRIASGSRACCFEFSRPQSTCILCTAAAARLWSMQHSARLRPSTRRCRAVRRYVPYVCASHANERARLTLQCIFRAEEL
jgi:hypothetical protein